MDRPQPGWTSHADCNDFRDAWIGTWLTSIPELKEALRPAAYVAEQQLCHKPLVHDCASPRTLLLRRRSGRQAPCENGSRGALSARPVGALPSESVSLTKPCRIVAVLGTRPEAIKLALVIHE